MSSLPCPASPSEPTKPRLRWKDLFIIEGSGVRTALSAVIPLVIGQLTDNPALGGLVGMGGIQVAFLDFVGATWRTMMWGTLGSAAMALLGGATSQAHPSVAVMLMFVVAFVMGMLAAYGEVMGNAGFVLTVTYAFGQVRPVNWNESLLYGAAFGTGGVLSALMTLLLWRLRRMVGDLTAGQQEQPLSAAELPPESSAPATTTIHARDWREPLRKNLNLRSSVMQHSLRTATATAIGVAICRVFQPPHGFWLILTVLVIIKPDYHATRQRVAERVIGSVCGGLVALVPLAYIHNVVALDIALLLIGIIAFSHLPRNYGVYVLFLTPFVVLLTNIAAPADKQVAFARIYETLLGGTLAFVVAFLLRSPRKWPLRPRKV